MDPISASLTGIALVKKSVDFVKSNIQTANDIKDIAGALDGLFAGEKHINQQRFSKKSIIGQTKDAANSVIDAKLLDESREEMRQLVDARFGFGTWQQIINERAKRLQEEKEQIKKENAAKKKKRQEIIEAFQVAGLIVAGFSVFVVLIIILNR